MGRPNEKAAIYQAAFALIADGKYPSVDRVREHRGTGSFSTIGKWMKLFREEHEDELEKVMPRQEPIPQEFHSTFKSFYNQVLNLTEDRLESERVHVLESENDDLKKQVEEMEATLKENAKAMNKLTEMYGDVKDALDGLKKENAELVALLSARKDR